MRSILTKIAICGVMLLLTACENSSNVTQPNAVSQSRDNSPRSEGRDSTNVSLDRQRFGEKRIHEIHSLVIAVAADELQARYQRDLNKCTEIGCEIISSNISLGLNASLKLRVPPDQLTAFLRLLGTAPGEVKNHGVTAEDKSIEFVDTSARLETLEALRARLRALLEGGKAQSVEDILKVEKELARVQGEIDTTAARKRFLEKITANATVNVEYTVPAAESATDYEALRSSFRYGWQGFIASLSQAIMAVGIVIPWILFVLLAVWFGHGVYRVTLGRSWFQDEKKDKSPGE